MRKKHDRIEPQTPHPDTGKWNDTRKHANGVKPPRKRVGAGATGHVSTTDQRVEWTSYRIDKDFADGWDWSLSAVEAIEVLRFLEELEAKTWGDIEAERTGNHERHKKHHWQPVDSLSPEARERLRDSFMDSEIPEQLFRFRLSGTVRLWGCRVRGRFEIIWFDRNHQVCPQEKD